jgi:hypothetical protein
MTTVELATSLSFGSNLSSTYLQWKFWLAKLFGLFVKSLTKIIFVKCTISTFSGFLLYIWAFLSNLVKVCATWQNCEVCQVELASLTWLGWLVRAAGTVFGLWSQILTQTTLSFSSGLGLIKRKVLDSSPRYVPRALLLFYQIKNIRS